MRSFPIWKAKLAGFEKMAAILSSLAISTTIPLQSTIAVLISFTPAASFLSPLRVSAAFPFLKSMTASLTSSRIISESLMHDVMLSSPSALIAPIRIPSIT
jgi:hypothetical protein